MKKRIFVISTFSLIVLGLIIFIFWEYLQANKSAIGKTITSQPQSSQSLNSINYSLVNINNPYASFGYPKFLSLDKGYPIYPPTKEEYNFSYRDIVTWDLAITIDYIPQGSLKDNNSYQFRMTYPNIYQSSTLSINNQEILVFTDKNIPTYNKVAFLINGPYQATVALSGDDPSGTVPLQKTLTAVLSSWRWN